MSAKSWLRKSCLSALITGLLAASMNISWAQGSSVVPFCQVGYKNIGFNFNLPMTTILPPYGAPALDLKFRDAGVWGGSIGIEARLGATWFATLRADGNATKNISVITLENYPWGGRPLPFTWSGPNFQTWDIDGKIGYTFVTDWSLVGGVRYDYLTVAFRDPVDANGSPIVPPGQPISFRGDVFVKTRIPYLGLQLNCVSYKALLLYSPFSSASVTTPQTVFVPSPLETDNWVWTFGNGGSFLEGSLDYNVPVRDSLQFGLWARGTWMGFIGDGNWTAETNLPPIPLPQSATGSLNRYDLGGGLSATLEF